VRSPIRHPKDFWSGLMFTGVGLAAVGLGRDYSMGTATRMGPAYFPTALGMVLTLIGIALVIHSLLQPGEPIGHLAIGPLGMILGATVLFGIALRGAGLVPAIALLVVGSACASREFRWASALGLAVGLAGFGALVFVKLLGLPIPLLGAWFGA
jgi:putative tricarboxylic transport membrane protein